MKKITAAVALSLLFPLAYAQGSFSPASSVAMTFSREGRSPAALAMGNTVMCETSNTSYSVFGNASALPFSENAFDIGINYESWGSGSSKTGNINTGAGVKLGRRAGLSAAIAIDNGSASMLSEGQGIYGKDINPTSLMAGVGFGYRITKKLGLGANVRYLNNKLSADDPYSAVSADLLLTASLGKFLLVGGVTSLGSKVKSKASENSYSLPTAATIGGRYSSTFGRNVLDVRAEAEYYFYGALRAAAGASFTFVDIVSIRAGYNYGGVTGSFASVGAGVKFSGIRIDAACLFGQGPINGTFCIGAGFSIPEKKKTTK